MNRSDTEIHQVELLLTLDYLLNYTDESHPATQQDICRHANNFGLKYDSKAKSGNDVRRQRIGDCLQFLQNICLRFEDTDKIPFSINMTDSGKFYLEKKNNLNEEQIIKILSAIKNDKYTRDEDTDYLVEKLLDAFSNCYNREHFKEELSKACKDVNKYNFSTNRKMRLVYKAFKEGKMIKIKHEKVYKFRHSVYSYECWYRVYMIKEYENKPYAILLCVSQSEKNFSQKLIFDTISNLNIPNGKDSDVLLDDFEDNRDLNELFASNNHYDSYYFKNIDNMLKANVRPEGGFAFVMSFYFDLEVERFVKQSFEEYFSEPLEYTKCRKFEILEERNYGRSIRLPKKIDKGMLKPIELKEGEKPKYGVCNILLNKNAFISWVLSNYSSSSNINDIITIVGPSFIKEDLVLYYYRHLIKYVDNLDKNSKEFLLKKLNN